MTKCKKLTQAPASLIFAGLAWLGNKFKIQARLGSGSKAGWISELSLAWAWKEVGFRS